MLERFRPHCRLDHITQLSLTECSHRGIRGFLIDIDNTIAPWGTPDVVPEIRTWLRSLEGQGFSFCLVSNSYGSRVRSIAAQIDAVYVCRAMKPTGKGFREGLKLLGLAKEEVAVIGDQMVTDILGGNCYGLTTIWVRPLSKREFFTTKANRLLERIVFFLLQKRGLLPPVGEFRKS